MAYVEQLLTIEGRANRRLGEEILQQRRLEAMHTGANQTTRSMNVYGSTCPLCCGDMDDAAFLRSSVAACQFCRKEPAAEQSRSRWRWLEVASRFGQGQAQRAPQ